MHIYGATAVLVTGTAIAVNVELFYVCVLARKIDYWNF